MKELYYPNRMFKVILRNGAEFKIFNGNCQMRYNENKDETKEIVYTDLKEFLNNYAWCVSSDWNIRCRRYIKFDSRNEKFLVNDIDKIVVCFGSRDVMPDTSIRKIAQELKYEEFLQFVFDKEQSLRSAVENI